MKKEDENNPVNWVEVHVFKGVVFAEMAKEVLENNDIPSVIKRNFFGAAYSVQGSEGIGTDTKLLVPEEKLRESKELIAHLIEDGS